MTGDDLISGQTVHQITGHFTCSVAWLVELEDRSVDHFRYPGDLLFSDDATSCSRSSKGCRTAAFAPDCYVPLEQASRASTLADTPPKAGSLIGDCSRWIEILIKTIGIMSRLDTK
jgi:hypothetical protein